MTGGADKDQKNLDSIIKIKPSSGVAGFSLFPLPLPIPLRGHSLVQLNDTHFFLYGGYVPSTEENLNRAWILNIEDRKWEEQEASVEGRRKAFAGLVNIDGVQVGVIILPLLKTFSEIPVSFFVIACFGIWRLWSATPVFH